MEYKSVKGYSGWGQLGILAVFLGGAFILTGLIQLAIILVIAPAGMSMTNVMANMQTIMMDPKNVGALRLSQVLGTCTFFFVPAIAFSLLTNGKDMFWLGFSKYFNLKQIIVAFAIIYAANICASPLADLTKMLLRHAPSIDAMAKKMEDMYNAQILAISNLKSWPEYIMALFIMAFFPAMFEEVLFRGTLQGFLVKWWKEPLLAIIVTSVIFSLVHMSIYLFLSRVVLGFALGLLYHKGKNIWVNIIAHFLNNAIAVTMLFYMSRQKQKLDIEKLDPKVVWYVGFFGLAALMVLFVVFDKVSRKNVSRIEAKEDLLLGIDPIADFAQNVNKY